LSGADAPNGFMPMMRPDLPTYRSHPKVDACSSEWSVANEGTHFMLLHKFLHKVGFLNCADVAKWQTQRT
jgi:hypothetical protein